MALNAEASGNCDELGEGIGIYPLLKLRHTPFVPASCAMSQCRTPRTSSTRFILKSEVAVTLKKETRH